MMGFSAVEAWVIGRMAGSSARSRVGVGASAVTVWRGEGEEGTTFERLEPQDDGSATFALATRIGAAFLRSHETFSSVRAA